MTEEQLAEVAKMLSENAGSRLTIELINGIFVSIKKIAGEK